MPDARVRTGTQVIEPPRPLTTADDAVLRHLLSAEFRGAEQLRGQIEFARVSGRCTCGCPTIDLVADRRSARAATDLIERVAVAAADSSQDDGPPWISVSEARLEDVDPPHDVLLFVTAAGWLASVELVAYTDRPPSLFPPADRLSAVYARNR